MSRIFTGVVSFIITLALLSALIAYLSPYWVSGKFEAVTTVTVVKEIDSGLFKDHAQYYLKDDTVPDNADTVFPDLTGTHIEPEVVQTVKGFLVAGILLLAMSLKFSIYRFFCGNGTKWNGCANICTSFVMSIFTSISAVCIASCLFIYKEHAIVDLDPRVVSVGASWRWGLTSCVLTLLIALVNILTTIHACCTRDKGSSGDNGSSEESDLTESP